MKEKITTIKEGEKFIVLLWSTMVDNNKFKSGHAVALRLAI